jgi:hypothetical protein
MVAFAALLVLACALFAQQPDQAKTLREQIRSLEVIDSDPATSPEVRTLNRAFLAKRREQLQLLLQQRIGSIREYLASVSGTLTAEERQAANSSVSALEREVESLKANSETVPAATSTRVSLAAAEPLRPDSSSSAANAPRISASIPADETSPTPTPTPLAIVQDCGITNSYTDAPPLLTDIAERVAEDVVLRTSSTNDVKEKVNGSFNKMLFYAVADALTVNSDSQVRSIRNLKAYQYLGETARTDKQVGSPSSSTGTTSAIEKPGFARLLGFAVEKGAILKDVNGSALTLSTSPYVLYTLNGGDTADNYARAGFLNRIGVAASFNIEDQNTVLASARRNQLTDWSVRLRLYGDRSTRSRSFQNAWRLDIQPAIERRLNALGSAFSFMDDRAEEFDQFILANDQINTAVIKLVASPAYLKASDEDKKKMVTNTILCNIKSGVFDEIATGRQKISDDSRDQIVNKHVPALAAALQNLEVVRGVLKEKLDDLSKGPLATFAYINHRDPATSDYSEFKFVYEQDKTVLRALKVVGNASFTIYNRPNPLLNQSRTRDFNAALSLEGAVDARYLKNQPDLSKITYAFTGTYQRMKENEGIPGRKPDLAAFQFKVDFPIYGGLTFPIAVTYASGTEHTNKDDTRINFGFKFDMDKLFALTKLVGQP